MKTGAKIALGLVAVGVIGAAGLGAAGWIALHERPGGLDAEVEVPIPRGATGRAIVARLGDAGLVTRPTVAYWYLRATGALGEVEAGTHLLPGDASLRELDELLRRPASADRVVLTLIPQESIWQAADRFEAAGVATAEEVLALAADHGWVSGDLGLPVGPVRPARPDGVPPTYLDGFLYPETYHLPSDTRAEDAVRRATRRFARHWKRLKERREADLLLLRKELELSEADIVVLASLVAEETKRADEAATIAGVFVNRLHAGMPLQTDPTLMYRPDRVGQAPTPAERKDGTNPYNTYAHDGLPPGPICSPTASALEAVLAYERHEYVYFAAKRDGLGSHAFAVTYDDHRANVRRYLRGDND